MYFHGYRQHHPHAFVIKQTSYIIRPLIRPQPLKCKFTYSWVTKNFDYNFKMKSYSEYKLSGYNIIIHYEI